MSWLDEVNFNRDGLVAATAQDHHTGRILMQAWMNREALALTAKEQQAVYWSRSRGKLWRKGESSGHVQKLHELRLDCDGDSILLVVEQLGGIACHTGRESCFYRKLTEEGQWLTTDGVLKSPDAIYGAFSEQADKSGNSDNG
ncbi:phosphoribosyl-AMP cyclohydrolase [Endozoicomonas numazuensis]